MASIVGICILTHLDSQYIQCMFMVCNALANTTIKVLGVSYAGFVRNMSALRNTKTLVSLVLARLFKNYGIRVVFKSNIVWGKGNSADRCNSKFIHGDKGGPPGGGGLFFLVLWRGRRRVRKRPGLGGGPAPWRRAHQTRPR